MTRNTAMDDRHLIVEINQDPIGALRQDETGRLAFRYLPGWVASREAFPLSQSLPLRDQAFDDRECLPFFSGLLPDSNRARSQLAGLFQVSADNDFALLERLGRDCAGAVTLRPHGQETGFGKDPWIEPLDENQIAALIDDLPERPLHVEEDEIMLSLAGVHDKAAVFVDEQSQVHLPHLGYPSSHILKIDISGLEDSIRTEHFCLRVARALGLSVPHSEIRIARGRPYMLIARYDRHVTVHGDGSRSLSRVHQEDFCQALGVLPSLKYEKEGGPGLAQMFELIRRVAAVPAREIGKLLDHVMFNLLIGNPDAHAKNYALVYRNTGITLSPIYDVNNAAAFRSKFKAQRPRIAQAIGGERNPDSLTIEHIDAFATECGLQRTAVRSRLRKMVGLLPSALGEARRKLTTEAADTPLIEKVVDHVTARCNRWSEMA